MRSRLLVLLVPGCGASPQLNASELPAKVALARAGEYRGWPSEPAPHASAGPHGEQVRTFTNPPLFDSLKQGASSHPVGSIVVKELFTQGRITGWAINWKEEWTVALLRGLRAHARPGLRRRHGQRLRRVPPAGARLRTHQAHRTARWRHLVRQIRSSFALAGNAGIRRVLAAHDLSGDGARRAAETAAVVAQYPGASCGGSARASDVRTACGCDAYRGCEAPRGKRPLGAQVADEMDGVSERGEPRGRGPLGAAAPHFSRHEV